jgi:hypothetical protein
MYTDCKYIGKFKKKIIPDWYNRPLMASVIVDWVLLLSKRKKIWWDAL